MRRLGKIISAFLVPRPLERFLIACCFSTVALLGGIIGLDMLDGMSGLNVLQRPAVWLAVCCGPHWILACAVAHSNWNSLERLFGLGILALNCWLVSMHLDWMAENFFVGDVLFEQGLTWWTILTTALVLAGGLIAEQVKFLLRQLGWGKRFNRAHYMILFAVLLFAAVKWTASYSQEYAPLLAQGLTSFWVPILISVAGAIVPWGLAMFAETWRGQVFAATAGWVFAGIVISFLVLTASSPYEIVGYVLFGFESLLTVLLLARDAATQRSKELVWVAWWSCLRGAAVAITALMFVLVATLFDIRELKSWRTYSSWVASFDVRQIQMLPEVRFRPSRWTSVDVKMTAESPRDFFERLMPRLPTVSQMTIRNLAPGIELKALGASQARLFFMKSLLDRRQMFELLDGNKGADFWDCEFVNDGVESGEGPLIHCPGIGVSFANRKSFESLIETVGNFRGIGSVYLRYYPRNISDEEVAAISRLALETKFNVRPEWLPGIWDYLADPEKRQAASKNLTLILVERKLTKEELAVLAEFPIALEFWIDVDVSNADVGEPQVWDLLVGFQGSKSLGTTFATRRIVNKLSTTPAITRIRQEFEENHWVFAQPKDGPPAGVWLPDPTFTYVMPDSEAAALRTLSFDFDWMQIMSGVGFNGTTPLESIELARFTGLERLALGQTVDSGDYTFLAAMPNLRELSILLWDNRHCATLAKDLPACKNLERLVLSGSPNKVLVSAFQSLPALKEIILIEVNPGDRIGEAAALQATLNGPTVRALPLSELNSILPPEFLEHREKVRQRLLNRE